MKGGYFMAGKPKDGERLLIRASIDDSPKAVAQLQAQLDKVGKKLKLVIGQSKKLADSTSDEAVKVEILRKKQNAFNRELTHMNWLFATGKIGLGKLKEGIEELLKEENEIKGTKQQQIKASNQLKRIDDQIAKSSKERLGIEKAINSEKNKGSGGGGGSSPPKVSSVKKESSELAQLIQMEKTLYTEKKITTQEYQNRLAMLSQLAQQEGGWLREREQLVKLSESADAGAARTANQTHAVRAKMAKDVRDIQAREEKGQDEALTKQKARLVEIQKLNNTIANDKASTPDVFKKQAVIDATKAYERYIGLYKRGKVTKLEVITAQGKYTEALRRTRQEMGLNNKEGNNFFTQLKKNAVKALEWGIIMTGLYGTLRKVREGFEFISELDKNLTNIKIVTGKTAKEMENVATQFSAMAKELGATTNEMMVGATEWFRQGKTTEETAELLRSTMMLSKLGAVDAASATEYLTSALNGFKMEATEAVSIVDKLVAVDNAAATSVSELAVALQRSSNSAQIAGVGLDTLIGYVGTVSSVTRKSAESIGESFKTMFARLQNVKAGQIDEDGMGISDVEKALDRVNIKIRDSKTTFRGMDEVLIDLSKSWNKINQVEQNNIANAIAGKRNECPNIQKCIRLVA